MPKPLQHVVVYFRQSLSQRKRENVTHSNDAFVSKLTLRNFRVAGA
jgi:hypothetical protein